MQQTLTFLFSDVEGSTRLLEKHGALMGIALSRHHQIFEEVIAAHGGVIFETVGDAVYAAFESAPEAAAAALHAHLRLGAEDWDEIGRLAVRISLQTGPVESRGRHFFGPALFRAARLQVIGYGEQTLVSKRTAVELMGRLPNEAELRDLGTHRLKDLAEPEHVYQLLHPRLRADFPALKSLDGHPHNLPVQLTTFIGRETEIAEISHLVDEHRMVSVVGPGGIGKTRIALQVAAERLDRQLGGAFFVDLSAARDPTYVLPAIAVAIGIREEPGDGVREVLIEHLRDAPPFLIIDNVEQLLPDASNAVSDLLGAAPGIKILATSRATLRIAGEQAYKLPPLATSGSGVANPSPAETLLLERARSFDPHVDIRAEDSIAIREICSRLDGLPLAIELAAARLPILGANGLSRELRGGLHDVAVAASVPERHRTVAAAIRWSVDLLPRRSRTLFARLAVFPGDFRIEAAEAIAGGSPRFLSDFGVLVDHSLVRSFRASDSQRFGMLTTIREFARGLLEAHDEELLLRRFVDFHVRLASESPRESIESDLHNWRFALETAETLSDGLSMLRMMTRTYDWWLSNAMRLAEASDWFRRATAIHTVGDAMRAEGLWRWAYITDALGDVPAAVNAAEESLMIAESNSDDVQFATSSLALGAFHARLGDTPQSLAVLRGGLTRAEEAADVGLRRRILTQIAELLASRDTEAAATLVAEAVQLARSEGDEVGVAEGLATEGYFHLVAQDYPAAERLLVEAVESLRVSGAREDLAFAALNLATAHAACGRHGAAVEALTEALDAQLAADEPISLQFLCLLTASALAQIGEHWQAVRLIGGADAASEVNAVPYQRLERVVRLRVLRLARRRLGREQVIESAAEGAATDTVRLLAATRDWWRRQRRPNGRRRLQ